MNQSWALQFLQDETAEFFLSDPSQGELLSASAWRCGMALIPMSRETFRQIAVSLNVDARLICFHVNQAVQLNGYSGGWMFVFRDDFLTPEVADKLRIGGQIPETREDVWLTWN